MSVEIESPKFFECSKSNLQFFWCKRKERFALNSLEVLDCNQLIYRCLKSSGVRVVVFLDFAPSKDNKRRQYRYITYDKASYCVFNFPDNYNHAKNENDFNDIISLAEKEIEKSNEKKDISLINRQNSASNKVLPPVRRLWSEGNVEPENLTNLATKIVRFFNDPAFDELEFTFVLSASIFLKNTNIDRELNNLLYILWSTDPVINQYGKTILIKVHDGEEYKAFCDTVGQGTAIRDGDILEVAKEREGERLRYIADAKNDEIRNIFLRFRLLYPEIFKYTPQELGLYVDGFMQYAKKAARRQDTVPIDALNHMSINKKNIEVLSKDIHSILSSLYEGHTVMKNNRYVINQQKAALAIERLPIIGALTEEKVLDLEEIMKELNEMDGLDEIKRRLERMYKVAQFKKIPPKPSHFVFKGRPGTGKTEVARLMGKMFYSLGVLSTSKVVEVSKSDLTGPLQGDTSTKPKQKCQEALGGVLLVDEAYQIGEGNPNSGDSDIITTIMKFIEDHRDEMCTIFTGYGAQMDEFMRKNPGMTGRVGQRNIIEFPDYSVDELMQIATKMAQNKGLVFDDSFSSILQRLFIYRIKHADDNYANARDVREIIDEADENLSIRMFHVRESGGLISDQDRITLIDKDLGEKYRSSITITDKENLTFEEISKELNEMVGLKEIKSRLERVYKSLETRKKQDKGPPKPSHFVFKGRPGTGKTEVARQLGKIYHAFGVLPTSSVIEVSKSDLTGSYQGDTSTKPKQKCQEALGGVLLVDEAYQIGEGNPNSGDSDIITTIMKFIEDHRDEMCTIFTGYGAEMDRFIRKNPGMASRVGEQNQIVFPDYEVNELVQIAEKMVAKTGYKMGDSFVTAIRTLFTHRLENAGDDYGNARDVRQIIDYACESLEVRLYDTQEDDGMTLIAEDLNGYGNYKLS